MFLWQLASGAETLQIRQSLAAFELLSPPRWAHLSIHTRCCCFPRNRKPLKRQRHYRPKTGAHLMYHRYLTHTFFRQAHTSAYVRCLACHRDPLLLRSWRHWFVVSCALTWDHWLSHLDVSRPQLLYSSYHSYLYKIYSLLYICKKFIASAKNKKKKKQKK